MSGSFDVERPMEVDQGVAEVMRARGMWLGPSDDWEHQKVTNVYDAHDEEVRRCVCKKERRSRI